MYSNKENVNMLTALMLQYGVKRAVICPGSRNIPLINNFVHAPEIACFSVVDERSAGFYAIGMAQERHEPVAVCVTSGSALLNLLPAVAEAWYQHLPFLVISADRPEVWIDQLDGQTLPQVNALKGFVKKQINIPEPLNEEGRWHCKRLLCEALMVLGQADCAPVHVNVPLSEPLFVFDEPALPCVQAIRRYADAAQDDAYFIPFFRDFFRAQRPMVVLGSGVSCEWSGEMWRILKERIVFISESLSLAEGIRNADEVLAMTGEDDCYAPDFVLYAGDCMVSKRLKSFLRAQQTAVQWRVECSEAVTDTFMNLSNILYCRFESLFQQLYKVLSGGSTLCAQFGEDTLRQSACSFVNLWNAASYKANEMLQAYQPTFSQMLSVKLFEEKMRPYAAESKVHYANSMPVRLANLYARHRVYCNRGVNGIEGCLSTAAGMSVVYQGKVCCVIGDLAFFYDQNALWNTHLKGNLRILLLNNGGGGIFHTLSGADQTNAFEQFIAARHRTSAQDICRAHDVIYLSAGTLSELEKGLSALVENPSNRPIVLEVFTHPEADAAAYRTYFQQLARI